MTRPPLRLWSLLAGVFLAAISGETATAQTDSIVCQRCVIDSIVVDTTIVRIDTTFRVTVDTTFRDSVVKVAPPVIDSFPRPLPIDVADPFTLTATCQKRAIHVQRWYNRDGNPLDLCAGEYAPLNTPPPPPTDTTPPPTGGLPAGCLNNPGLPVLVNESFNGGKPSGFTVRAAGSQNVSFTGGRYTVTYPRGFRSGSAPYGVEIKVPTVQVLYLCLHNAQSGGGVWDLNGTPATKWMFVGHDRDAEENNYINWARTMGLEIQHNGPAPNSYVRSQTAITDQRPHTVEVIFRANTPGVYDGGFTMYVDGRLILNTGSVMYTDQGQPSGFNRIFDNGTWGGLGGPVKSTLTRAIDDLVVAGR